MKFTFGRTLAAQKLETLLEDKPLARRKVSRLLSEYTRQLFQVTGAKEPSTVKLCMELLRQHTLNRVDVLTGLPEDVRTYAKNVVVCRYRVYRHCFDELTPYIVKMLADEKKGLTSKKKGV